MMAAMGKDVFPEMVGMKDKAVPASNAKSSSEGRTLWSWTMRARWHLLGFEHFMRQRQSDPLII